MKVIHKVLFTLYRLNGRPSFQVDAYPVYWEELVSEALGGGIEPSRQRSARILLNRRVRSGQVNVFDEDNHELPGSLRLGRGRRGIKKNYALSKAGLEWIQRGGLA